MSRLRLILTRMLISHRAVRSLHDGSGGGGILVSLRPNSNRRRSTAGKGEITGDESTIISRPESYGRQTGLQPVDGAAGSALRASLHRTGLRVQRVQSADDQAARRIAVRTGRLETHRTGLDLLARHLLSWRFVGGIRPLG